MKPDKKNFALIGAAGYVAPRHMRAIKETGNELVAILDPSDSVGIIDTYFPKAQYFNEIERFDRHLDKKRRQGDPIDYLVVCSPNYLHDAHCRIGLRNGCDVICEKPLVLNPWNIDGLQEIERDTGKKIYNILQLRLHPAIVALKRKIDEAGNPKNNTVELDYITSRGSWYDRSWKGDLDKSGGIITNIGIHFFDMLLWIFGDVDGFEIMKNTSRKAQGTLHLTRAHVQWLLSIDAQDLPQEVLLEKKQTFRNLKVNGIEIDFSAGFTDLHSESYRAILAGNGFGTDEVRPCIELVGSLRDK